MDPLQLKVKSDRQTALKKIAIFLIGFIHMGSDLFYEPFYQSKRFVFPYSLLTVASLIPL